MRKRYVALISLLIVVVLASGLFLTGCTQDQKLPGIAWAEEETLTYGIWTDNVLTGSLVIVTKRLPVGQQALPKFPDEKYDVNSTSSGGTLITKTAKDLSDNITMYSEALMNGFKPVASYKEVNTTDSQYTLKARYDGTRYFYSYNGGEEKKVRIKTGFMDNEIMYSIVRCYELESNYTTTFNLVDPTTGNKEALSVAVTAEGTQGGFEYVNGSGESAMAAASTRTLAVSFTRTKAPVGKSLVVYYTVEDKTGDTGFYLTGDPAKGGGTNRSSHVPVMIQENNVKYVLSKVIAN
jgi:hypothetical protein